ncbi:sugar ABC transporter substrate-binding protein [Desulfosporosinus sp. HMP52]|uniref:extracellular solute-binding protein n=1 Tax=Desulfosporosinus sp. HMP52 TaxID=1487923 RepID=UPI00051FF353|nr:extracellular solute-binding protein [Desulfosporosinus sp. HMP52]KGK85074.1 sugar ABC transporter substrate-binding protein [Desulfosporosinus sp. HMP52]
MRGKGLILFVIAAMLLLLPGCNLIEDDKEPLDPSKPVTVIVWHYYNGHIKDKFDALVADFNETVGVKRGIVVDAQSLGDVEQLANAVYDAANKNIGSQRLPDIFMAYPDNAYRIQMVTELANLEELFSKEELERYRAEFLKEGRFGKEQHLKILPIAKSSEILYVNKTFWDEFSQETGADIQKLKTWEGLIEISELYREHTGKAFLGIDSSANYMLLSGMQLGREIYSFEDDSVRLNFTEDVARTIWDYYYIPYIKGYFEKSGRFSSDDAKTGTVLAYTGSTAGSGYFPAEVTVQQDEVYTIEPMTLPYPYFGKGKPYAFQQGAGMCVTKSDKAHEFAAGVFLKWFTEPSQNIEFAVSTGYFPVMNESLDGKLLLEEQNKIGQSNSAIPKMIDSTLQMFKTHTLYFNKPFKGSYEMRLLLESNLSNKITRDLELLDRDVANGEDRTKVIDSLVSDSQFDRWYGQIKKEGSLILGE